MMTSSYLSPTDASKMYSQFIRDPDMVSDYYLAHGAYHFMLLATHLHELSTGGPHIDPADCRILLPRPEDAFVAAAAEASRVYRAMMEVAIARGVMNVTASGGFEMTLSARARDNLSYNSSTNRPWTVV